MPDPANQFASPYTGMGNSWVNGVDPDGQFFWAPVIIGAMIGAFTSGIHADRQDKSFLSGAWKGAFIGGISGYLGAGITNGVSSVMAGGTFRGDF